MSAVAHLNSFAASECEHLSLFSQHFDDHIEYDLFQEFAALYSVDDDLMLETESTEDIASVSADQFQNQDESSIATDSLCSSGSSSPSVSSVSSPLSSSSLDASTERVSTGRYLCLGDRQRIRELIIQHNLSKSEVARKFNISLNSVKYILSARCTENDTIRAKNGMDLTATRSNLSDKKRTALDTHLCDWIKTQNIATLTRVTIENQAQTYMRENFDSDFVPGKKWFQNFRKRCGIKMDECKDVGSSNKRELATMSSASCDEEVSPCNKKRRAKSCSEAKTNLLQIL